jgi:hypothetical protein
MESQLSFRPDSQLVGSPGSGKATAQVVLATPEEVRSRDRRELQCFSQE